LEAVKMLKEIEIAQLKSIYGREMDYSKFSTPKTAPQ
jgi:hypothetical protein